MSSLYKKPSMSFYEFVVEDIITGSNVSSEVVVGDGDAPVVPVPDQGGGDVLGD